MSYPGTLGIDHVHGLGAGVDGMSQFLLHAVVELGHVPDTGNTRATIRVYSQQELMDRWTRGRSHLWIRVPAA